MQSFERSIDVFSCESLEDLWSQTFEKGRSPSIRSLSAKLGYKSDRSLGLVVQNKRKMNREMLLRLAQHYKWTSREEAYVQTLMDIERAENAVDKKRLRGNLSKINVEQPKNKVIISNQFHLLMSWLIFPVLNVIEALGNASSKKRIVECFPEKYHELVKLNLESLLTNDFINETEDKQVSIKTKAVYRTTKDVPSKSIREYHRQALKQSICALEEQSVLDRAFLARSMKVKKDKIPEFKKRLREVLDQLDSEFCEEPEDCDSIYQLNFQLFRVAETQP